MMSKTLVAVVGPTASGKTDAAIQLANHYKTEIISFDSRQFYKEMSIGTAKPNHDELQAATHHFIGHLSVADHYTAGMFANDANELLKQLFEKHDVVVAVGGSGLFLKAWVDGLDEMPEIDKSIREQLQATFEQHGIERLQEMLKQHDERYSHQVDLQNPRRLIRALEVCISSGQPYSSFLNQSTKQRNYNLVTIGLLPQREQLYERIDNRVDVMMINGLVEEVKSLIPFKLLQPLHTVGYTELFQFFDGLVDFETAVNLIKQHTRNYAKRQITWFKKENPDVWMTSFELNEATRLIESAIDKPAT